MNEYGKQEMIDKTGRHIIEIVGEYRGRTYTSEKPHTIDLTPVDQLVARIQTAVRSEEARRGRHILSPDAGILECLQELNRDQLEYFTTSLVFELSLWINLYQNTLEEPEEHLARVLDYRKLEAAAAPYKEIMNEVNRTIGILQEIERT